MGMGIVSAPTILMLFSLVAGVCVFVFMKNRDRKVIFGVVCVGVFCVLLLFVGFMAWSGRLFIKSTNLEKTHVGGYAIEQKIEDTSQGFTVVDEADDTVMYEVDGTNLINLNLSKQSNEIVSLYAYRMSEKRYEGLIVPSIDGLVVGTSTYNDVINVYGDGFTEPLFIDAWAHMIVFKDLKRNVTLKCCFDDNVLIAAFLES
jgi:hypothetical protein